MWIKRYADAITVPPWGGAVTSNASAYLLQYTWLARAWRRFKRDLLLLLTGQLQLAQAKVPQTAKRVLYVYLGTPQLGDSIMDLSSRVLWQERGLQVDMFTHGSIAYFYAQDPSFNRVITDARDLDVHYDFLVLQSYGAKCLKFKWRYFFSKPFMALHGHYYGCEFNRLEFADGAWRYALGLPSVPSNEVCPPVFNLRLCHALRARKKCQIFLAVGGVVAWRTYSHWADVIREASKRIPDIEWVLLGSANGLEQAASIMHTFAGSQSVINYVDAMPLEGVFELLQTAGLLVAADGGLLHVGRAAQAPVLGLFAGAIHPRMRFGRAEAAHVIHTASAVEQIAPEVIASAIQAHFQHAMAALTFEYLDDEPSHDDYL